MKSPPLSFGAQLAIAALCALGLFAGSYVLAIGGFFHTPKRSNLSVFVSGPQAYFVAAIFFAFSGLAALALLRSVNARWSHHVVAGFVYLTTTYALVVVLRQ